MVMEIIKEHAPNLIFMAPVCGPWLNMQRIQQDQNCQWLNSWHPQLKHSGAHFAGANGTLGLALIKWPRLDAFGIDETPPRNSPGSGRFCPSTPATKSLKPWPALRPPTLALKLQKPCPERWPLTAPSLQPRALPTQPAKGRRLVASLCASNAANGRRLVADLVLAFEKNEGAARGKSTKQRGQRARLPQSEALGSNRRSCNLQAGNVCSQNVPASG